MGRNSKKNIYTQIKNHKIFVIIHPITKEFYVHFSTAKTLDRMYSSHWTLNNYHTRKLFEKYRETIYPPELYLIEEKETTTSRAYSKQLVWVRYFREHGYKPLNDPDDVWAANDLFDETLEEYELIKDIPINEIIHDRNRKCANYHIQRSEKTPEEKENQRKQMKFFCSFEEYELIKMHAKRNGKTVSAYVREVSLQGSVLQIDFENIKEHTKELSRIKGMINALIKLLVSTNCIYQSDVEKLLSLLKEITESENKLLHSHNKFLIGLRKKILKELKK